MNASRSMGEAVPSPTRRVWWFILVVVLVSGAGFRLAEFFANRSLWLDEAALAQNVLELPLDELIRGRLHNDQCAPPGFLLASRAVAAVGSSEQFLRLIPLLAGLGALPIFGWLAWKRLGLAGALTAAALSAWSWPLIYYSNEFKPYSTDVLVSVLFLMFAGKILSNPLTLARIVSLIVGGLAALTFSQSAIFLLAALGAVAWLDAARQRQWREFVRWSLVGLVWLGFFFAELPLVYGSVLGNANLFGFYQETFLQLSPPAALKESLRGAFSIWALLTAESFAWLWLGLLALGLWKGIEIVPRETIFIMLTVFFTVLASWMQMYPLVARLLLFLAPLAFWLVARGVDWLASLERNRAAPIVAALLLVPFWPMLCDGVVEARHPTAREQLRPLVANLAQRAQPGDLILVWPFSRSAFDYYWPRVEHPAVTVETAPFDVDQPISPKAMATRLPLITHGQPRIWLVATHYEFGVQPQNLRTLTAELQHEYLRADEFSQSDGALGFVFSKPRPQSRP